MVSCKRILLWAYVKGVFQVGLMMVVMFLAFMFTMGVDKAVDFLKSMLAILVVFILINLPLIVINTLVHREVFKYLIRHDEKVM